ncbi:hypothetical protein KSP40_PGU004644 [Platanthera guangdongensis]|uniref:Uncharacterized protein n=1 Tax=Platanthera guangdongensis TaxID=2320717 RepID=A0ABR2MVE4_9ASPA
MQVSPQSSFGVRTRAKTPALQQLQNLLASPATVSPSSSSEAATSRSCFHWRRSPKTPARGPSNPALIPTLSS